MSRLWQDLAYGCRSLRRQPGVALVALAALGTTIGLNTSLFTVFSFGAFRPWPVRDPDRVVRVFSLRSDGRVGGGLGISAYRHVSEHARSFDGLVAMHDGGLRRIEGASVNSHYVSTNYFDVLRVAMEKGRGFLSEEDDPVSPRAVAVLSHWAWQQLLRGDPDVVGRSVRIDDASFTVVGVAVEGFSGAELERCDLFLPLSARRLIHPNDPTVLRFLTRPDTCCSRIAGRLATGVSRPQARAELEHLNLQFATRHGLGSQGILLADTAVLSDPRVRGRALPVFGLMFLAVTLVLLLACANVGSLLLARATARRHEIAVRLSLGASRGRVIRQLLTEGALLASGAAAIGIGIAFVLPSYVVRAMFPISLRLSSTVSPDLNVLAYTLALSVAACMAFALAPALHGTRGSVGAALKGVFDHSVTRVRLRGALLAMQVAISVVLLAGSALLVRGIAQALEIPPGFSMKDVAVVSFSVSDKYLGSPTRGLLERLERELQALPGTPVYGLASVPPLAPERSSTLLRLPGQVEGKGVLYQEVSAGYFDVLQIPIVRGRNFAPTDDPDEVALVNEKLARRYWPETDPVGRTLVANRDSPQVVRVVGVVKDTHTTGLGVVEPMLYRHIRYRRPAGHTERMPSVLVRDADGRSSLSVAALATRLDPQARAHVASLSANVDRLLRPSRVGATLAGVVGLLALALATIGLAGVFAYSVQQRTREIGIRLALGARAGHVVRLVLASSSRAIAVGLALGLAGAIAGSRLLQNELYGLSPLDPFAYAGVAFVLALAGCSATYGPARRAMRVDPTVALRYE